MFDFAITQTGDLIFTESNYIKKPFKIRFAITKAKVLRVKFDLSDCYDEPQVQNGIKVTFNIENVRKDKKAALVFDEQAKTQAIKMRLATALGEVVDRESIGSTLEMYKHKPLFEKSTINGITAAVIDAIKDIVSNVQVKVMPVVNTSAGYSQDMAIYIYEDGFLVFKYDLKG
jgi:phage baseplate assembly protein W